ncbi:MAG: FimV family protein [Burkholderiales bacterium]|nr:FimV family protein [Burkholderiales bacterium]
MAGILLLTISTTHAAGLGKLTVASALGQPLRAEIDLVSVQKDELTSLTAKLASPDAFKQAELEYTAALASVKVSVEKRPNGQLYIELTSSQPVEEPILDILIELSWASGRLVREYTALMDPPEYNAPAVAPVAKPEIQADPKPAAAAKTRPAAKISRTPENTREAGPGDGSYSVKSGDTLAKIARSTKVEGVSLEQMLVGLYQNNRRAFAGNMNRLQSGKILRIPDRERLAAIEPTQAVQEVKAQAANWNAYRQKLAAAAQASTPADGAAQSAAGRINATVEDQAAVTDPGREVLRLSKGEQNIIGQSGAGSAGAGGADPIGLQERLRGLEEEATAREKALREANERVAQLEGNIKSMQRLLEIKNESLAQAQNQASVTKPPEHAADSSTPVTPPVAADANASAGAAVPPIPEANPAQPKTGQPEGQAAAPANVAENPAPAPAATLPADEPSLIARVLAEPLYLAVGALLLALIAFAVLRRRRSQPEFENSIMTGGDLIGNTVFGDTSGGVVDTSDSSLITDFSKVGLEHISTDEVDPLAEAEVYIAYGRDAQAEEILKEAANRNPQRYEIHLKLLEIYAMRQSLGAFETLAGELYAATEGQGEVWNKAAELGRSLDPDNPLYASAQPGEANPSPDEETQDAVQGESIDQATRSEFDFNSAPLSRRDDAGMNFDTAFDEDRKAEAVVAARNNEPTAIDFEVTPIEETEKPIEAAAAPDTMIDFDFDLGAPETRANTEDDAITLRAVEEEDPVQISAHEEQPVQVAAYEEEHKAASDSQASETATWAPVFDLDVPQQETEDKQAVIELDERDRKDIPNVAVHADLSTIDLNFDSSTTVQEKAEAPVARNDQWYDVQTKFDLAKAYQEMGDKEGAREILQEVVQEGDAEQQANSKALLASLG